LVPSSNLGVATVFSLTLPGNGAPMDRPARLVTPITWLYAPDWLTSEQAAYLSGHNLDTIDFLAQDGCVDTDDEDLIEKQSLYEFQECLALV
jgi:hypothetical protein